jgi:hypothetical protein
MAAESPPDTLASRVRATLESPAALERLCMRLAVLVAAVAYLPVMWRAPAALPLLTPVVFLPMLAVFAVSSYLRRSSPETGGLACHIAASAQLLLAGATPLCYPRVFRPGDGLLPLTYVITAILLSIIAALLTFLVHELLQQRSDGRVRGPMPGSSSGRNAAQPRR